jgi:hypothetical protein
VKSVPVNIRKIKISIGAVNLINLNLMDQCGGVVEKKTPKLQVVESKSIKKNKMKLKIMTLLMKKIYTTPNVTVASNLVIKPRIVQRIQTSKLILIQD